MKNSLLFVTFIASMAILYGNTFSLVSKNQDMKSIKFVSSTIEFNEKDGYTRLTNPELGSTVEDGMPELPTYSTFFHMEPGKAYNVEFEVVSSHTVDNIEIFPYQGEPEIGTVRPFLKNVDFYTSKSKFPESNITVSEPMIMRDIEVGQITFIPFEYNAHEKQLTIYDDVNISVIESGEREDVANFPLKRSYLFEPFYEDLILDYEPLSTREEYQPATIMYVCGGASLSHPFVQDLIEWRRLQGYIVYAVSTSETGGSSASAVENYLEDVFNTWETPPEIVGLIGDTGGTYGIGYHTYDGGATDVDYSYLSGNDFLPEVFIGRISVNSSSDISNVINKTLTYEKALNQESWWYERAALVGDPSSSGVSTITTMQYVQNIMENFGVDDIRTNYSNGNYDNWVEDQFDDGILYYHYRGYYGSSGIGESGLNSGIYTPFAGSLTCGTGDFNGTSNSESFLRAGSYSDPQGAVGCVGVSTLSTHTAYNNIVHMGMVEGIYSKGMNHAGASLANGKLALLKTYPTNPNNAVSRFSAWPNLMGDPALHLWKDHPHDFSIDTPATIPEGTTSLDVFVTDENDDAVENARVTLNFGDEYFTGYTDMNGITSISWPADISIGHGTIGIFKKDFRLLQRSLAQTQVQGPALTLDNLRTTIDDSVNGNGNFMMNPGEQVSIQIPILNYGNSTTEGLELELESGNQKAIVLDSVQNHDSIEPNSEANFIFSILLDNAIYEAEDLDLKLYITDSDHNQWMIPIPTYIYGPKLELIDYNILGSGIMNQGQESRINLTFKNTGSMNLENIIIEFIDNEGAISFPSNSINVNQIDANTEFIINDFAIHPSNSIINGSIVSVPFHFSSENGYVGSDYVTFTVGERDEGDPLGPDEHGYYIYDSGDVNYSMAPVYDWIEIVGNGGTNFNFSDGGDGVFNNTSTDVIQLPFTFKFYGVEYNEITVSTNGWIAFGDREMAAFRNYSLPGAGGPSPMVAAFWDDLTTDNGGDVYRLINDNYVIIQWNEMRVHDHGSQENTLQMIIYNPENSFTPTGDGEIKIQYKEFNNISDGDYYEYTPLHGCYSTVGIENQYGNVGLEYTFNDNYPIESMELDDNTAIFISTVAPEELPVPNLTYSSEELNISLAEGEMVVEELEIGNDGESESILNYNVNRSYPPLSSPFLTDGGGPDAFGYFWSDSDLNEELEYDWIDISGDGSTASFSSNDGGTDNYLIGFDFPFYGVNYSEFFINANGWIGFGDDNTEWYNQNLPNTNFPLNAIMGFWDDLNPVNSNCNESCSGEVFYHSNDDRLVVWFSNVAHWVTVEFPESYYDFQIVIYPTGEFQINYRDIVGGYSATVGVQDNTGNSSLQVDEYNGNYFHDEMSVYFDYTEYVDWLSIVSETTSGDINQGEEVIINLEIETMDLPQGDYTGYLNINTNIQASVQIPVYLYVGDALLLGDVNGDDSLNVLDIVQIVNYVLGTIEFSDSQILSADVNGDGLVNVLDIVTLVNMILTF